MRVAVVGATGLVGSTMLKVLEERKFPLTQLIPVASEKSVGKEIVFKEEFYRVKGILEAVYLKPDIAFFSAGAKVSREWAPKFAKEGTTVIDNSSSWRMEPNIPLVVPEINGDVLTPEDKIIANPNCSTIQMVMVLNPLHKKYKVNRVVVSTYQSVSGTGAKGVMQLMNEREGNTGETIYPHSIDLNCLPHIDVFMENNYTREEMKMVNETRKIMRAPHIQVSPTCVRVPVRGGHSESVNVEFENDFDLNELIQILKNTPGVIVQDDPANSIYPMPVSAEGKDEVFVGRIRRGLSLQNTLNCWIVADNLRKGAATNAIQIAEYLIQQRIINREKKSGGETEQISTSQAT
ncbi:MAG TPA: aspartate-semialdehyde dehydrogenase [Chitinophagales bacterium]|nr:aspartate-semialdehyde dehydrogenase [Chitinophagales bacterium]